MRVLLDACVPQKLRLAIPGHDVQTAQYAGLDGLLDKTLLDAAEGAFDVLVTCDRGFARQQNMAGRSIAVVVMVARTNRIDDLLPLVTRLLNALRCVKPGEVRDVS